MFGPAPALSKIPDGLRIPLIKEFSNIVQNFMERRWSPSELSGGRFCEIVYTILHGFASGSYAASPTKPKNFVDACKALESSIAKPRSFQILLPRMLPPLYEIRNNRGVGHVGGDVDPNFMDSTTVLSMCSWVMAELVRVFHGVNTEEAQRIVDSLVERRIPLVWKTQSMKRVLDPRLPIKDQVLLLLASSTGEVAVSELFKWTGYKNRSYFNKLLRILHESRLLELREPEDRIQILPPGSDYVQKLISEHKWP